MVAGAIIGVGIFANPANVARILGEPSLILLAWALGGGLALLGGFAYAELGSRLPEVGGQYTYLARAWPPVVAFLYGIALLFIINGGSVAAVSIVFASYVDRSFLPLGSVGIKVVAAVPHPGDLVQGLRSLEEGFIPPVLDESILDGKIVVDSRTSFASSKELAQTEGIFAGISAGAVLKTAQRVAERLDAGNIVCLFADGGWKYLSTQLWTTNYEDLPEDIEDKIWW